MTEAVTETREQRWSHLRGMLVLALPTAVVLSAAWFYTWRGWGSGIAMLLASGGLLAAAGLWAWGLRQGGNLPDMRGRRVRGPIAVTALCAAALATLAAATAVDANRRERGLAFAEEHQRTELTVRVTGEPARGEDMTLVSAVLEAPPPAGTPVLLVLPDTIASGPAPERGARFSAWFSVTAMKERSAEVLRLAQISRPTSSVVPPRDPLSEQRRALTDLYRGGSADSGAALVPGMVSGDRSLQSERLDQAMTQAGLSHVTAVSGSNISFLVSGVAGLCRLVRVPRPLSPVLTVAAVLAFVGIVGPDPSVLRAAVMGGLSALGVVAGRPRIGVLMVAGAALVLVCADPWQITRTAFRLSVLACLGIAVFGPGLTRLLEGVRLPRVGAETIAVSVASTLACTPELVGLSAQQSPLIVPVNVIVSPAVAVVGTLGPALLLVAPLGAFWCAPLVQACRWSAQVVATSGLVSAEHGPRLSWPGPPLGVCTAAALCWLLPAVVLVLLRGHRGQDLAERGRWRMRMPQWGDRDRGAAVGGRRRRWWPVVLVVGLIGGGCGLLGFPPTVPGRGLPGTVSSATRPGDVVFCDVGQGDSMLLVGQNGQGVLLDAGPEEGNVRACLRGAGIDRLCAALISHLHADHVGGLDQARDVAEPDQVIYGTAGKPAPVAGARPGREGESLECDPWQVRVISAPDVAQENDASLVIRAGHDVGGGVDLLTAGDAETLGSHLAVAAGAAEHSGSAFRILKVSHHGSANGGTELMEAFDPDVALIGVGNDNGYGHPAPTILAALKQREIPVLRTDQDGTVRLRATVDELQAARHG